MNKKKFKQEIINLKKIDVSKSNIQMINLIKISSNNVDEISEFDFEVKRASKINVSFRKREKKFFTHIDDDVIFQYFQ